jgi:hypothetical protein
MLSGTSANKGHLEKKPPRAEIRGLAAKHLRLAEKLKPLLAGLECAEPFAESCRFCGRTLLPEIGRCTIFHNETEFQSVKGRFVKETQLRRRGWNIAKSQGGTQKLVKRFLGEPIAHVPKVFSSNLFDPTHCIPLYSKADVEAVEATLEFRACLENSRKGR